MGREYQSMSLKRNRLTFPLIPGIKIGSVRPNEVLWLVFNDGPLSFIKFIEAVVCPDIDRIDN